MPAFSSGDSFYTLYKIILEVTNIFGVAITYEIDQASIGIIATVVFMAGMVQVRQFEMKTYSIHELFPVAFHGLDFTEKRHYGNAFANDEAGL
jgi:hypothetical protein